MHFYSAYGMTIRSYLEVPELTPCTEHLQADCEIRFGSVSGPMPAAGQPRLIAFAPDGAYFAWPHIARVGVTRSGRITLDPLTSDDKIVRFALLGPVMAAILHLRGVHLLHGSAVACGRRAILLIGHKQAGKSTMAAAFAARGCSILNDDVLPIAGSTLSAGYPGLKLAPSIAQTLLPDWPTIGASSSDADKIVVTDTARVSGDLPIGSVIILDPHASTDVTVLSPSGALPDLLQHGYALKFGPAALTGGRGAALFESCTRLAQQTHVIRVRRPDGVPQLRALVDQLLDSVPDSIVHSSNRALGAAQIAGTNIPSTRSH